MPIGQRPVGGETDCEPEHDRYTGGPSWTCGQHSQDHRRRQHRTEHRPRTRTYCTSSLRIEIKIPFHVGNRSPAAALEGRDSTDHATATDHLRDTGTEFCWIFKFHINCQNFVILILNILDFENRKYAKFNSSGPLSGPWTDNIIAQY